MDPFDRIYCKNCAIPMMYRPIYDHRNKRIFTECYSKKIYSEKIMDTWLSLGELIGFDLDKIMAVHKCYDYIANNMCEVLYTLRYSFSPDSIISRIKHEIIGVSGDKIAHCVFEGQLKATMAYRNKKPMIECYQMIEHYPLITSYDINDKKMYIFSCFYIYAEGFGAKVKNIEFLISQNRKLYLTRADISDMINIRRLQIFNDSKVNKKQYI
jgi:hypothetical protein